jgi:aconitate hydratase
MTANSFDACDELMVAGRRFEIFRLDALQPRFDVARLPFSLKVLLENLLRTEGNGSVSAADVEALAGWEPQAAPTREMMRGTFANIRLRNLLAPGTEAGVTLHLGDGEQMSIYDAAMKYIEEGVPLIVLAGKEYGSGSSRDWAAKGTRLLGVRAVIAESFERIHRSNLVGMGVLPLQYPDGESAESLGISGEEEFSITGLAEPLNAGELPRTVSVRAGDTEFEARVRIDTPKEADYFRHGGILQYVLRSLMGSDA